MENQIFKRRDFFFWLFVGLYLFIRDWPFGGTMQTITDIFLFLAAVVSVVSYLEEKNRKDVSNLDRQNQGSV